MYTNILLSAKRRQKYLRRFRLPFAVNSLLAGIAFIILPSSLHAQEAPLTPRVKVMEASILIGFSGFSSADNSLQNFKTLSPNSTILARDFSDFSISDGNVVNASSVFSALIGFSFRDKEGMGRKLNPVLRVGITFSNVGAIGLSMNRTTNTPYDTLVSNQTGNITTVDSVYYESVFADYSATQLQLDGSIIWRTAGPSRWSLFGGAGLRFGWGLNASTTVSSYSDSYLSIGDNFANRDFVDTRSDFERFRNENSFSASAYLPFGLDYRLGDNPFWSRIHFAAELRPSLSVQNIPELETVVAPSFSMVFGWRVTW